MSSKQVTLPARLLLTHGAGSSVESDFMQDLAEALARQSISVSLFNFNYMQRQLNEGKKRPPSKASILEAEFIEHLYELLEKDDTPVFVGGKSMGGRIATHLLASLDLAGKIKGAVVFGYPFHPPGQQSKLRIAHMATLTAPLLIMQGERDTFGNRETIEKLSLPDKVTVNYLADGDHSLKPRKTSGFTQQKHLETAALKTANFIRTIIDGGTASVA